MSVLLKSALKKNDLEFQQYVIKETLIEIATGILNSCNQKDPVFETSVLDAIEQLDVSTICSYLETNNNVYVKTLTDIVSNCIKDVSTDDLTTVIPAVRKSTELLNTVHEDDNTNAAITPNDASALLETVFTLVLSVLVPMPQQAITKHVVHDVFEVLRLQIIPLTKNQNCCKFFKR